MKSNQEILDEFGEVLISNVHDFNFDILKRNLIHMSNSKKLENNIDFLCKETFQGILFNFLKLFEENEQFKIIYEENGKQVNLVEISEMLKAEIHNEDGWIARFSKELKKEKDN